jgi:hypothetical protein
MTKLLVTPDANSAVNVGQLAGTTTDTNSGNKSAGTLRVVLATDQPALTNALKVSPSTSNLVSGLTTAMTGTTSTAITGIGAPGSNIFNYITQITVGNSHGTVGTFVEIQDGSGGTTFYTIPAAAVYGGATLSFNPPLKQPTANTALYCKNTTTGANVIVSASGFTGA